MPSIRRPLRGSYVWTREDLERDRRWIHRLQPEHLEEIDAALDRARARRLEAASLSRDDFELPALGAMLAGVRNELEEGRGIALLRGFSVERYDEAAAKLAFTGIGLHLGAPLYQNARGERLREIRDEGGDRGARYGETASGGGAFLSSRARVASTGELRFHTDRADVVALLCVRPAREGGKTRIASSALVHNVILEHRPDLLEVLFSPYPRSRFGEESPANDDFYLLPVMGVGDGGFTSHYSRTYIEAAQLIEGAPRLTAAQREAMDMLALVCSEHCIEMSFRPGDIQLLNSHVTYHSRSAYLDHAEGSRKRLLFRLWLCPPDNRALPEDHAVLWGDVCAGALRGGIGQSR